MPPAKKVPPPKNKAKVSKAKASGDKSIDETEVSHHETRADLLAKIQAVEREAVKASEHQNYMQLERDKIDAFWEITKRELQSTKIDLRDVRRELEVMEENHAMELRVQQHKIRQIEHERLEAEEAIRAEYSEMEIAVRQACRQENISVENEKLNIESEMRELSRENEAQCRKLKLEHAANLGDARKAFEENASSKVKEAEERMFTEMNSFQSRINEHLRDAEIRKSEHIEALVAIHNSAYAEMKDYFNALTDKHVSEIASLKQKLRETTRCVDEQCHQLNDLRQHNDSLVRPLEDATRELCDNRKRLAQSQQRSKHLEYSHRMLKDARAQVKALKWENEILIQKLERVEGELDVARISANGNLEHIRRVFAGVAH
jgi:hypothetical protein